MDEFCRNSRKRVLPVDTTPHSSQTNSHEKKRTTPKFVPPLKKTLSTVAGECLTHHPAAAVQSSPELSQGSSIELSGSQGSSIELSGNNTQPDSIGMTASPVADPPPKRSFKAAVSRHTYTLTKSHAGQLDKRAVPHSMAASIGNKAPLQSMGVFDFPVSQNQARAAATNRADTTCDADQSTGNLFRLNASMTGRSLEQQIATDIEVLAVIERTCAEIKEIRRKYSITAAQQQQATTSSTSSSQEKDSNSSQPYMSLFFSQYEE